MIKRPQLLLVPVIHSKCVSSVNICSHLALLWQPGCLIGHRGLESACFLVRDGCKHSWDFPSSTKCFATFLVFFIFMTLPLPHWFILCPQGSLSHSHIPPETQSEMKPPQTPSAADTHACTYAEGGVCTQRTVPNRSWQHCCTQSSSHLHKHAHTHSKLHQPKKKNYCLDA